MPPKSKEWYLAEGAALVERDTALRAMQQAFDRMVRMEYQLPDPLLNLQWMRAYVTMMPFNAIRAAERALSYKAEALTVQEISVTKALPKGYGDTSPQARALANDWERCLQWNMRRIEARSPTFRTDITNSAVMYGEICAQFVHLPSQMKAIGKLGGNTARYKAAMRYGDFAINVRNPQTVHTRYSDYMCEAVFSVTQRTAQQIVDIWGDAAAEIATAIEAEDEAECYLLCDYTDHNGRAVWAMEGDDESGISEVKPDDILWLVEPAKLDYPELLGWVAVAGGNSLSSEPSHQRQPLLYPIYRSEAWLNANITGSLMGSQAIAKGAQPTLVRIGPDPNSMEVEYVTPGGTIDALPGHDVKKLPADGLDPALAALFDRHLSEIGEATVARVLVSPEPSAGETFSGFNLRLNSAIGQLTPYRMMEEQFFGQAFEQMLLWAHATGTAIKGYGASKDDQGKRYAIDSEDIDPDSLYLDAALEVDVPIDRLQKITGAVQLAQLGMPQRYIMGELGVADPDKLIAEKIQETFLQAEVAGQVQEIQMLASGQLQQMAQQMAQQIMQQQAEQQQAQQGGGLGGPEDQGPMGQMANPMAGPPTPGVPGAQGQSPAQGGLPAAQFNPGGATFEGQTGGARNGVPVAA